MNNERMQALYDANKNRDPETFNMGAWIDLDSPYQEGVCRTPGCIAGGYAYAHRDIDGFPFYLNADDLYIRNTDCDRPVSYEALAAHFGLRPEEGTELFSPEGCGRADDNLPRALEYLRRFCKERGYTIKE